MLWMLRERERWLDKGENIECVWVERARGFSRETPTYNETQDMIYESQKFFERFQKANT
jgi:hypothetical protein